MSRAQRCFVVSGLGAGSIVGVAIVIAIGGPGAVFRMRMTALFGMAGAFAEATLAQLFKTKSDNGTFHGGPACYIQHRFSVGWGCFPCA